MVPVEQTLDLIVFAHSHSASARYRETFEDLANEWERETALLSSVSAITSHPTYLAIIALGPDAVPLILDRLAREPNHWFKALIALTQIDAAAGTDSVSAAAEAWLAWGRSAGISI